MSRGYIKPYPCYRGLFVPPQELDLPPSRLNPESTKNFNNHHLAFTKRAMGRFLITQTWRDLASNQHVMPIDVHNELHAQYDPPELPELIDLIDVLDTAYQNRELLRTGTAAHPEYRGMSRHLMRAIYYEYNELAA